MSGLGWPGVSAKIVAFTLSNDIVRVATFETLATKQSHEIASAHPSSILFVVLGF